MSVLGLLLWSTTPLLGLAALLGMSRFERYLLDDRVDERAGEDPWAADEAGHKAAEIAGLAAITSAAGAAGTDPPVEIAPAAAAKPAASSTPTAA